MFASGLAPLAAKAGVSNAKSPGANKARREVVSFESNDFMQNPLADL